MKQQFESVRSGFLLLLAAFIWGIAFVAQSVGMDYMGRVRLMHLGFSLAALCSCR